MNLHISKTMLIGVGGVLLLFAANHIEYACRSRAAASPAGTQFSVVVRQENGAAGHRTIGVAEGLLSDRKEGQSLVLRFAALAAWNYDAATRRPCPKEISALSGSRVTMVGFMYPLEAGSQVKTFCLLRSTQTCCYGPRPQYNQYVLVEMREPVRFERLAPVIVEGTFFAEARPEDGYIYRLEGTSAQPADNDETEVDAAQAARSAGLRLLDFSWLESARPAKDKPAAPTPPELASLDGQQVVLEGFCVGQTKGAPPGIIVGRHWWDGVAQGTPPDLFNAVKVFVISENEFPSRWQDRVTFTGMLRVTGDPKDWPAEGVASLHDAVKGIPGQGAGSSASRAAGPYLPVSVEILMLAGFAAVAATRVFPRPARSDAKIAHQKGRNVE